jgi:glycosyltransferase involved in cell wall biosynthesis
MPEPSKIAVLHLVYSLQMGGSEKVALDIASNLDGERFRSVVCGMDVGGALERELDELNIPHEVMHRRGLEPAVLRRLYRIIRRHRIDVVHTHHFTQLFFAAIPARLAGARIVHTEHEFFSYVESGFTRKAVRPLLTLCHAVTVVGAEVADYFVRTIGVKRQRLNVIPNGVALEGFDYDAARARWELGLDAGATVLGTIGRLEPEKDQMTLIEVFREIHSRHPSARLVIAGSGSRADALKAHAAALGVAEQTTFLGYRRDVARLLAAMDVFVLTSVREGLPVSLIEAMAARRPVVSSDVGSVRDLVRNGENGFIVPPRQPAAFVDCIERLVRYPELRTRLGEEGRRTAETTFSLPAVVRAYEDLYRSAADHHVRN